MALYTVNQQIVGDIHRINANVFVLINILQKRPLDREEASRLRDLENKMKWHAKHHQAEFALFRQQSQEQAKQLIGETTGERPSNRKLIT